MSIRFSVDDIEATYELLRGTLPFKRWKLPPGDEIGFWITRDKTVRGEFFLMDGKTPTIAINDVFHHTLYELIKTVAHEMCHLCEHIRNGRKDVLHGYQFQRLARQVCRYHSFDQGMF